MPSLWQQDNTITEVELVRQAKLGKIAALTVQQTPAGYQVIVRLSWHTEPMALRTRRAVEPRKFMSLERLVAHIRERYPSVRQMQIELLPAAKPARKAARRP